MEKPQVIMQVTMRPLHTSEYWQFFPPVYSSELQLAQFRQWQSTGFSGNPLADYAGYQQSNLYAERLRADSTYRSGLKISFDSGATYTSLVAAIDLLNKNSITTWWLDIQHQPTTLYAFTTKPDTSQFCGSSDLILTQLPEPTAPRSLNEFFQPDWRNSTLLLLLIGVVSAVRLGRRWRVG